MKSTILFNQVLTIVVLGAALVMAGCSGDEGKESIPVSFLTLSETEIELEVGDIHVLECIVSPYNADNQRIIWSTSHKSVATVKDGVVTAVKAGNAIVTAMADDNGKTAKCTVTVTGDGGNAGGNNNDGGEESDIDMDSAVNLSWSGTANCYIVSKTGVYKFKSVKGNGNTSVGAVSKVEVLWETFGTSVSPEPGELVSAVSFRDGYIVFQCHKIFYEGNAVVAAKDADGNILWSWHLWFTDAPQSQRYNDAGTMMDRNLGATSAEPGAVGALGLLYQWGRKDPFLGSSSIRSNTTAKSTIAWPSAVSSDSSNGTIAYATANPTTFIKYNSNNHDWYYTGSSSTDNTRWTTSDKTKSIYDPCPSGWRVPDGGDNGIWSKAGFDDTTYDGTNEGISFSISSPLKTWYPASGSRSDYDGSLGYVGDLGRYWSASPDDYYACNLYFNYFGSVYPSNSYYRASGQSVRCLQE